MSILERDFYNRSPLLVGPDILGKVLVRNINGKIISGRIVEVEAYLASEDEASHSFRGLTKRNASLFKDAGHTYIHSMHRQHCLDIVTQGVGIPTSILIRALEPLDGIKLMKSNRQKENLRDLTSGPGKLTQALQISRDLDGLDITDRENDLYVVEDGFVAAGIITTPRIGISKQTDKEYRFYLSSSPYISKNRFK